MSDLLNEGKENAVDGASNIYQELGEMVDKQRRDQETQQRLRVVEGLTEVKAAVFGLTDNYRFMITAAVQTDPAELGEWLLGSGGGFRAVDRPVNTSIIDQDHNWTFAGENGFILAPPVDGGDIIAARPHDIGSNDFEPQPVEVDAAQLLAETDPRGYNQVNVAAGGLVGVYIRHDESGNDLGNQQVNRTLREFATVRNLPIVEIQVAPQELGGGQVQMSELEAKAGNRLWKIKIPSEGVMHEIDVIKIGAGEIPRGMQPDEEGFDLRIQQVDRYGISTTLTSKEALASVKQELRELMGGEDDDRRRVLQFALRRIEAATAA